MKKCKCQHRKDCLSEKFDLDCVKKLYKLVEEKFTSTNSAMDAVCGACGHPVKPSYQYCIACGANLLVVGRKQHQ